MVCTNSLGTPPDTGLPASIGAAWGLREPASRGPRPGLTLERIVQAAIQVARTEGLGALSMARVAKQLGSSTMSLYRYVAAKDELLVLMVDAALGAPPPAAEDEDWRAGLSRWAWGYHDRARHDPWALRVPISGPPMTPNGVAWLNDGLWSLRDTGLSESEKASVVLLLSGYVRSEANLVVELTAGEFISDAAMSGYAQLLRRLTGPAEYPGLHRVLDAGVFDRADPPDEEFSFGLERILDGVAALIDRRG
jgi:AcrR family transcriptional regulator